MNIRVKDYNEEVWYLLPKDRSTSITLSYIGISEPYQHEDVTERYLSDISPCADYYQFRTVRYTYS